MGKFLLKTGDCIFNFQESVKSRMFEKVETGPGGMSKPVRKQRLYWRTLLHNIFNTLFKTWWKAVGKRTSSLFQLRFSTTMWKTRREKNFGTPEAHPPTGTRFLPGSNSRNTPGSGRLHKRDIRQPDQFVIGCGFLSRMSLMMSSTRVRRFSSFWRATVTLLMAYTMVEWSRPPNSVPMAASGIPVTSRTT